MSNARGEVTSLTQVPVSLWAITAAAAQHEKKTKYSFIGGGCIWALFRATPPGPTQLRKR